MNRNWLNRIICDDCEKIIPRLDDNSIDIVITSPPYNVDLGNNKYHKSPYDLYNDNREHQEFIQWVVHIFGLIKPKLVHGGRVCINIGDTRNGSVLTHHDIVHGMVYDLNYIPMTTIVWNKNTTSNRCAWGSYMSPSSPSFPCPFEYISVFANESKKKVGNKEDITVSKEDFIRNSWGVWSFAPETKQRRMGHNAMFPPELPRRLIDQLSFKGDTVLDPFSGMGTTVITAKEMERNYIGIELSPNYCQKSRARLNGYDIF